ncbi:aminopeptidase [Rubrivivax gelatinosus]|uniref:Aminopeptidase n=1 Tax=Rubrivivax gelatinosus TaxID=28068 RepID=A0ABS1DYE7_RUBGE|nr:aminopeptidase [Rubrivivax gelatinosus]MBK1714493.1 aminopeptidase [Rubrivivax gelatinosus]
MRWCRVAAVLAALALLGGCSTVSYVGQAIGGHIELLRQARPVEDWIADPATPAALRTRLELAQRLRAYAVSELKLPDNRSYKRYADIGRKAVVWNVVAAPELSLKLQTWCWPLMGCVGYRGYFSRDGADALAAELRAQGLEVFVYGVPAYSSLGWSEWLGGDPLLSTFIGWPEGELARLLFHELAHQVVYAADDTAFNESFATAVERLGGQRWLAQHADVAARADYEALDRRRREFRALVRKTREDLRALYTSDADDAAKRRRKAELMAALRARHAALKQQAWGGYAGYDAWFDNTNNAALGVQAAYDEWVPAFEQLFERSGADFTRFYAEVARLAALPKAERRAALAAAAATGVDE